MSSSRSSNPTSPPPPDKGASLDNGFENSTEDVVVGRVLGSWGRRGELKVQLHTDYEDRFASGSTVYTEGVRRIVEHSRPYKAGILVKLQGVNGRGSAERLRNAFLTVPATELPTLGESTYFYFQIIGMEVWTTEGEHLGFIHEIIETGSNDVYVVRRQSGRDILVPAIAEAIVEVNTERGRMTVSLLEGLL